MIHKPHRPTIESSSHLPDDDPATRDMICLALESEGFQVIGRLREIEDR